MPIFGARASARDDGRSRELVVRGEPVVLADRHVVLVDLVVRYDQVVRPDGPGLAWDPADEAAIRAVAVTTLRVEGEKVGRDAAMVERSRLADPVAHALSFAPVAAGFRASVVSLEVRAHDPGVRSSSEFRLVS